MQTLPSFLRCSTPSRVSWLRRGMSRRRHICAECVAQPVRPRMPWRGSCRIRRDHSLPEDFCVLTASPAVSRRELAIRRCRMVAGQSPHQAARSIFSILRISVRSRRAIFSMRSGGSRLSMAAMLIEAAVGVAHRHTGPTIVSTVDFLSGAQSAACLIAASKVFASKAGMLWIRPRPSVEYQTENARTASGFGASTMSTKS